MNIEEKIKALEEMCDRYDDCIICPLKGSTCSPIFNGNATEKAINEAYSIAFPDTTPHIEDSGERREFSSGAVRDMSAGKGRMDLLPWGAIIEVSKHAENGAVKYGEHNVDKGIPTHSLCDSGMRHLAKYLDGWDDEPHLLAAAWNLLWAIQMELKHPEMVDTPFVQNNEKSEE